jgi:glutamate mutase epsilon subunit
MTFLRDYRGFEDTLINQAQTDTTLIDQARQDSVGASLLTQGIAQRNQARYGAALTPAQLQQQQVRLQRANTLGTLQSVNDARLNQREANTALLSDLINIGQGLNRSSQQGLASAAANASSRAQAYESAKAQQKQSTYQTIGSLGAMAIVAMAF